MNFSFIGNGQISQAIQQITLESGHQVSSVLNRNDDWDFKNSDVIFECSTPESVINNIKKLCALNRDIVIITTGWYNQMHEIEAIVANSKNRVLWSSNFSIGVFAFFKIVEAASKLFNQFDEYDVWGNEIHHKNKIDSPSGTAKIFENIIIDNIERKSKVVEDRLNRRIDDNEFHFSSTRGGFANFGHTIGFDSLSDVIEIKHTARNRSGYAIGAIKAAEWLKQQPAGFYNMDDFLKLR